MTTTEKKFGTLTATVDNDMGDGATGCWIEGKRNGKSYSASLAALQDTGELENDGDTFPVLEKTIEEIAAWALAHGY